MIAETARILAEITARHAREKLYSVYAHPLDFIVYQNPDASLTYMVENYMQPAQLRVATELSRDDFDRATRVITASSLAILAGAIDGTRNANVGEIPTVAESLAVLAMHTCPEAFRDVDGDADTDADGTVMFDATKTEPS